MRKISPHFDRTEFACQCGCGFDTVDTQLIEILEIVRQHFMTPVLITSGCRCQEHNEKIGGSKRSQHLYGRAADFKVKGVKPQVVFDFLDKHAPKDLGLGLSNVFIHVDTRTTDKAIRWTY